jgi:hypothetical protein
MARKVQILSQSLCCILFTFTKGTPTEKRLDIHVISSAKQVADISRRC